VATERVKSSTGHHQHKGRIVKTTDDGLLVEFAMR
jgi:hypothetical protein